MRKSPLAANAEPAAVIDAAEAGFVLTIVDEPNLAGLNNVYGTLGDATAAAMPLAFTHRLAVTITPAAIRKHVDEELAAMAEAEARS